MPRLSDEKIKFIRSSVDIVEVVGNYLPLQRKGKGYWAVCPFHDDNNPSLSVSRELQIYHCFVCGAKGNVFTFLMNYLKISYIEAVKMVAGMAGIDVSELDDFKSSKPVNTELVPLYQMHEEANKMFKLYLNSKLGSKALEYLNNRQITADVIEKFQIGYAPNDDILNQAFTQMGFDSVTKAKSGLIIENNNHYYDRFKNRIIFPLWDKDGKVVGFSGRIYESFDQGAKYLNSPESPIFTKGQTLYNYHRAKDAIKKEGFVYLLEGFMDVIALSRVGIDNAVGIMGTALTNDHLTMIRRLTDTIHLCLDGDKAGQDAMIKNSDRLLEAGFKVKVIVLEERKDPDEILQHFGKETLIARLKSYLSVLEFKMNYYYQNSNMENYDERKAYLDKMCQLLSSLDDPSDIDYYTTKLANKSGFSREVILSKLNINQTKNSSNAVTPVVYKPTRRQAMTSKYYKSEQGLVYYMLLDSKVASMYEKELGFLYDKNLRLIANFIVNSYRTNIVIDVADLLEELKDNDLKETLLAVTELKLPKEINFMVIRDYISTIKQHATQLEIKQLEEELRQTLDVTKKAEIAMKIMALKNGNWKGE